MPEVRNVMRNGGRSRAPPRGGGMGASSQYSQPNKRAPTRPAPGGPPPSTRGPPGGGRGMHSSHRLAPQAPAAVNSYDTQQGRGTYWLWSGVVVFYLQRSLDIAVSFASRTRSFASILRLNRSVIYCHCTDFPPLF